MLIPWPRHRSRYRPSSFCWRSGFFAVRSSDPSAPGFRSGGAVAERGVLVAHRLLQPPVFKDNCRVYKSAARIACRPAVALEFGPGIPLRRGSASGDFAGRSCKICKFCRLSTSCPAPASPGAQAARSTPFARSSCSGSRTTPSHRGRSTSGSSSPRLFSWRLVPCCTSCCTSCPTTAAARTRKRHEVRRKLRREL